MWRLSTSITAYEVPPSAMKRAAVAVTFEYDKRFRNEFSTSFLASVGPGFLL
jgi:hypothetical protein